MRHTFTHIFGLILTWAISAPAMADGAPPTNGSTQEITPLTLVEARRAMGYGQFADKQFVTDKDFAFTIVDAGFHGLDAWLEKNPDFKKRVKYVSLRENGEKSDIHHGFDAFRVATKVMSRARFILIESDGASFKSILRTMRKNRSHFASMSMGYAFYLGGESPAIIARDPELLNKFQFTLLLASGNERQNSHYFPYADHDGDGTLEFGTVPGKPGKYAEANPIIIGKGRPLKVELSWNEWGKSPSAIELELVTKQGKVLKSTSSNGGKAPLLVLRFTPESSGSAWIRVRDKAPGKKASQMRFMLRVSGAKTSKGLFNGRESLTTLSQYDSPFLISVGSFGVDAEGKPAPSLFSSIGHTNTGEVGPHIMGPGQLNIDGKILNGTSFSTPFIAAMYSVFADYNIKNMIQATGSQELWKAGLAKEEKGRWGIPEARKILNNACTKSNKVENLRHSVESDKLVFEFNLTRHCMEGLDYYLHTYIRGRNGTPLQVAGSHQLLRGWTKKHSTGPIIDKEPIRVEIPFKHIPKDAFGKRLSMHLRISTLAQWDPVQIPGVLGYDFTLTKDTPKAAVSSVAPKPVAASTGTRTLNPGDTFRDCSDCPEMVVMPPGSFTMGSEEGDDHEKPAHAVEIGYKFAVGKFEVTQAQWRAVMGNMPNKDKFHPNHPVDHVSWNDVQLFLRKLNAKTGKQYRLLSESEWEYAGAGASGKSGGGWHMVNSEMGTHPVGKKAANGFGLHDMVGNLEEWVEDCWNDSYRDAPADGSARTDGNCSKRVVRGSSWYTHPDQLGMTRRGSEEPDQTDSVTIGFRVAMTLH